MRLIERDGVRLAVYEEGPADAPPIILVHGYPDEHSVWDGVAAALRDRFRVIRYDVRGAGASSVPDGLAAYALEELAADVDAVIAATAGGRRVHLVGHDWGAIQSWEAVSDAAIATRIASFTAISGPCLDHVRAWVRANRKTPSRLLPQAVKSWYIQMFQWPGVAEWIWMTLGPRLWPLYMDRIEHAPFAEGAPPTLITDAIHGLALYRANMKRRARRRRTPRTVDVPTQIVVPDRDPFVARAMFDGVEAWVPRLTRTDVHGSHWIVRQRPDEIAALVARHATAVGGA